MKPRKIMIKCVAIVLVLMVFAPVVSAHAYNNLQLTGNGYYWETNSLKYFVSENKYTQTEINLIAAAFNQWSDVTYGEYRVQFTFTRVYNSDDADIIFGKENRTFYEHGYTDWGSSTGGDEGPLEKAYIRLSESANIVTTISSSLPSNSYDFSSVILHEIGHALGIAHCCEHPETPCDNVMCYNLSVGELRRDLRQYDEASLIAIYVIYHPFE